MDLGVDIDAGVGVRLSLDVDVEVEACGMRTEGQEKEGGEGWGLSLAEDGIGEVDEVDEKGDGEGRRRRNDELHYLPTPHYTTTPT